MASAYRFSATSGNKDATKSDLAAKSRTGLNSINAAGGGGAPYGRAALQPGSRGYFFPGFGGAPQAGGETPAPTSSAAAVTPTPEAAAPIPTIGAAAQPAPTSSEQPAPSPTRTQEQIDWSNHTAEGSAAGGLEASGSGAYQGDGSRVGNIGDLGLSGASVGKFGGGALGGLLAGPPGALLGALAGYALGKAYDGSAMAGTPMGDLSGIGQGPDQGPGSTNEVSNMNVEPGTQVEIDTGPGGFGAPGDFSAGAAPSGPPGGQEQQGGGGEVPGGETAAAESGPGANAETGMNGQEGFARGGKVTANRLMPRPPMRPRMPHYDAGGPVNEVAGPDPAGPDDGYAALDQGEFVVNKQAAAQHGPLLEQINSGGSAMIGQDAQEDAAEGEMDDMPYGSSPLAPPGSGDGLDADDAMRNAAMMPMEQRQALMQAMQDPTLSGAMMALLGPDFMPVIQMFMQPPQPQQRPGGMMPPGGGGMQSRGAQNLASVMA